MDIKSALDDETATQSITRDFQRSLWDWFGTRIYTVIQSDSDVMQLD